MTTQRIAKWLWRCELVLVYAAVLATMSMMFLTTADALGRYLFNRPIIGAYEITEKYLMVAAIFLGLSYGYRGGIFIRVSFLVDRLPAVPRMLADHLAHAVSLAWCLVFVAATAQQALRALADDTTLTTLPVLVGPAYLLVPAGFLALTVMLLIDLPRIRRGEAFLFRHDAPTA
jgi:TRAP-type C4-dicarboxylate transport system permease small subunit